MEAGAVAAGAVETAEASEVDLVVGVITAHRLPRQFRTRTSSQASVGSEMAVPSLVPPSPIASPVKFNFSYQDIFLLGYLC